MSYFLCFFCGDAGLESPVQSFLSSVALDERLSFANAEPVRPRKKSYQQFIRFSGIFIGVGKEQPKKQPSTLFCSGSNNPNAQERTKYGNHESSETILFLHAPREFSMKQRINWE